MTFKRILCAIDFSEDSTVALRTAAELVRLYSGSLHLVHVIEARPAVTGESLMGLTKNAGDAMAGLISTREELLKNFPVTTEVVSGLAAVEILNCARQWRADLIVLGSKGITSVEEILAGGTADTVMKEASCSVLIVRR